MYKKKLAITIGDVGGIGPEIVIKSLNSIIAGLAPEDFIIIGNQKFLFNTSIEIGLPFPKNIDVIDIPVDESKIEIGTSSIEGGKHSFLSLKKACEMAKNKEIRAIISAPVSKKSLNMAGYHFSGQTEILKTYLSPGRKDIIPKNIEKLKSNGHLIKNVKGILKGISSSEKPKPLQPEMLFVAKDLKVMLLTRHIRVSEIPNLLGKEQVIKSILALKNSLTKDFKVANPKIAICGLNPHAGENGLLGREEEYFITPAVNELISKHGVNIEGPFPADTLFAKVTEPFIKQETLPYDAYVACYHDQGLVPVKVLAMNLAVNTTINLPVIRTSPSHGTAFDIAGENKADYQSMIEAIKLADKLSSERPILAYTQNKKQLSHDL